MSRRILTGLLSAAALLACTAGTSPKVVSPDAPPRQQQQAQQEQQVITLTSPMQPLNVGQSEHSAFPGLAKLPNGELHLVWRQGADHVTSRDGDLMRAVSTDGGLTYHDTLTLRSGADFRDPSISVVDGAAHLTMFTGTATAPAQGAYAVREFGLYSRIDTLPYAAISAPIVKLPDGRLGSAFYGRKTGETIDTAWMGWSSNQGQTWSTNRIANTGLAHAEPYLVVDGTLTHMFFRWGNDGIGVRTSPDSGVTWGPVRQILSNATGRPTTLVTQSGTLVLVYRSLPSKDAVAAYSLDHGATWQSGGTVLAAPAGSPNGMTYAAMAELTPGTVHLVVGMEETANVSRLWGGYLTETTP